MTVYSHSRLETFEACPQKYKFRYIDKLEVPEEQGIEAFVGSRVHETLQKLYRDLQLTKLNTVDELLAFYKARWDENWSENVRIVREGVGAQHYFDYGAQCIRNYYAEFQPFDQSQTLKTEAQVLFNLDQEGKYPFQGYIDRIAKRSDGTYEIHDYKTGQYLPAQAHVNADRQLALYQIGLGALWPDVERVELIWHFVGFSSTLRSTRRPGELEQLRQATIELIRRIEAEEEFAPQKSALCDWCEYRAHCPLWRHVALVEGLSIEARAEDDGVRLVDEYAKAKGELAALQEQVDDLKERLIALANQQGVMALQGNRARVTVKTREWEGFPGKNDAQRPALEDFLRRSGSWDQVSQLDTRALEQVLRDKAWPADKLEQLRAFASSRKTTTVYLQNVEDENDGEGKSD